VQEINNIYFRLMTALRSPQQYSCTLAEIPADKSLVCQGTFQDGHDPEWRNKTHQPWHKCHNPGRTRAAFWRLLVEEGAKKY